MELPESAGRKLDFLTQEMFRETNTIGSKANDVELAREVIEVKTDIDGKPRLANHPDVGPYAAPAEWWKDIDSGKATIVDGAGPKSRRLATVAAGGRR